MKKACCLPHDTSSTPRRALTREDRFFDQRSSGQTGLLEQGRLAPVSHTDVQHERCAMQLAWAGNGRNDGEILNRPVMSSPASSSGAAAAFRQFSDGLRRPSALEILLSVPVSPDLPEDLLCQQLLTLRSCYKDIWCDDPQSPDLDRLADVIHRTCQCLAGSYSSASHEPVKWDCPA